MEQQTKKCPYCGGEIMAAAKKCKHCGKWLDGREDKNEIPTPTHAPVEEVTVKEELTNKETSAAKEESATKEFVSNVPQTKKCPYCGKEIRAVAKMCKYCGERVVPREENSEAAATETEDKTKEMPKCPVDANISKYMKVFFWLTIIGHMIGVFYAGKGDDVFFVTLSKWIPEELGYFIGGIGVIGLFVLLMRLTKKLGKPMNILCGSIITLYGIKNICSIIGNDVMTVMTVFAICTLTFILGFRLTKVYRNSFQTLGIAMMIYFSFFFIPYSLSFIPSLAKDTMKISLANWNEDTMKILHLAWLYYYYKFYGSITEVNDNPQKKWWD